jgi:hypothetical protein
MVSTLLKVNSIENLRIKQEQFQNIIYSGTEQIKFRERHPIFKALMKIEFEDALRSYHKDIKNKDNQS